MDEGIKGKRVDEDIEGITGKSIRQRNERKRDWTKK